MDGGRGFYYNAYNPYRRTSGLGTKAAIFAGALAFGIGADYVGGVIADSGYGSEQAEHYIEQSGYSRPRLLGVDKLLVSVRGCDRTDEVKYEFEAVAPNGTDAHVAVCKGILKAATIRQG